MVEEKRIPDYVATTVIDLPSGQSRWREIGVAFANEPSGTITVLLDAVPVMGKIVLMKPRQLGGDADALGS